MSRAVFVLLRLLLLAAVVSSDDVSTTPEQGASAVTVSGSASTATTQLATVDPSTPLVVLTDGLPPGYTGRLTYKNDTRTFSALLTENVAVSEYLVKEDDGSVTFSIFLKDPTKISKEESIVVQVDFGLAEKLNICFLNGFSGVQGSICPDGSVILFVTGNDHFRIKILDNGRVETSTEHLQLFSVPRFAKLGGRPISDTNKATAVPFSMTVYNATFDVYLHLAPGHAATVDKEIHSHKSSAWRPQGTVWLLIGGLFWTVMYVY